MADGLNLPVAEMAGEEQDALALRVGRAGPLLAFEFEAAAHRLRRERAEPQQLEQQAPEVHEHGARDLSPFGRCAFRKRRCEIGRRRHADARDRGA